eukprot:1126386-Prymnesium_polylepis.1
MSRGGRLFGKEGVAAEAEWRVRALIVCRAAESPRKGSRWCAGAGEGEQGFAVYSRVLCAGAQRVRALREGQ